MTQHLIKKVELDIAISSDAKQAHALQNQLAIWFQQEVCPRLASVFDEQNSDDNTLIVKRIEVDLGELSFENLRHNFKEKSLQQIEKALDNLEIKTLATNASAASKNSALTSSFSNAINGLQKEKSFIFEKKEQQQALFFHFLRTGNFSWLVQKMDWTAWETAILEQIEEAFLKKIIQLFMVSPNSLERFVFQFSSSFLERIARHFKAFLLIKKEANKQIDKAKIKEVSYWKKAILGIKGLSETELKDTNNQLFSNNPTIEAVDFYMQNAGLVLIIPCYFLLLKELDWLEENQFKTAKYQVKAAHLLHWIATGKEEASEDQLLLPKIACGIALEQPIERHITFTKAEKTRVKELIEQLLVQWTIGENKSIICPTLEGCRINFFQRQGKLTTKGNRWLLQIETQATDAILMKTLPWTISMTQFSWMEKLLQVEWI